MSITKIERPTAVDDLVERAGSAASSIAGDVEQLAADVGRETADTGSDLAAETRTAIADRQRRTGGAIIAAALLAIGLSVVTVLMRRRAARVRAQS
jgi:hypothetical protein